MAQTRRKMPACCREGETFTEGQARGDPPVGDDGGHDDAQAPNTRRIRHFCVRKRKAAAREAPAGGDPRPARGSQDWQRPLALQSSRLPSDRIRTIRDITNDNTCTRRKRTCLRRTEEACFLGAHVKAGRAKRCSGHTDVNPDLAALTHQMSDHRSFFLTYGIRFIKKDDVQRHV